MCFLVCVCVWASCILYVCGVCLGPGPPRSCCVCVYAAGFKVIEAPVKGSSSATDQNTSGQWSQPVKWIDVRQENKWVSDSFPLSDESRVTAESLFTETERRARWGWLDAEGLHRLHVPFPRSSLVLEIHVPARPEYSRAQDVRVAYRNLSLCTFREPLYLQCTAQPPKLLLCSLSSQCLLQKSSRQERRGENM